MQVVLTGGGTGGHVIPNVAVINNIKSKAPNIKISYIGSTDGVEKEIIKYIGIDYYAVPCGKLRRYISFKNFIDFFKVPVGILKSISILRKLKPNVVFSKGGYVSLHVALAANILRIPVIMHESDISLGLANKISMKFADKICISFEDTLSKIPKKYRHKVIYTGSPIRKSILNGNVKNAYEFTGLNSLKPIILVMGGSLGAMQINNIIQNNLDKLLESYQIIHLTGPNKKINSIKRNGYIQYEFINSELKDIYAISDIVITRGGANSLFELALLGKKVVCIPISDLNSRGEQVNNAKYFIKLLHWEIMLGDINFKKLNSAFNRLNKLSVKKYTLNGTDIISDLILKYEK